MAERRGRGVAYWIGVLLIVVGLGLLADVGWQLWGTNWISDRHHREAVNQLQDGWGNGQSAVQTDWGKAKAIIEIPRFGRDYEVPVLEGTSEDVLAAGYGHFRGTAGPGQVGNYALAAHRITHGEPLRRMPELETGDRIKVLTRKTTYVYRLTSPGDGLTVDFHQLWVTDPLPTNPSGGVEPKQRKGQRLLTLTTCSELFHTDNRLIAFGVLAGKHPTPSAQSGQSG